MATEAIFRVINRARLLLQDPDGVRWTNFDLNQWLNGSYTEIVNLRPDASTATDTYVCTLGTRQVLTDQFSNAQRLLSANRNSEGRALQLVPRQLLDTTKRRWHAETPTTDVEFYVFEPITPTQFWVYPPAESGAQIEVTYSFLPEPHVLLPGAEFSTTETLRVPDSYVNAVLDYILYRAYSKDAENQVAMQRAVAHYQAMQTSLGVKMQSDQASNPQ
jgi:hypothetical protein